MIIITVAHAMNLDIVIKKDGAIKIRFSDPNFSYDKNTKRWDDIQIHLSASNLNPAGLQDIYKVISGYTNSNNSSNKNIYQFGYLIDYEDIKKEDFDPKAREVITEKKELSSEVKFFLKKIATLTKHELDNLFRKGFFVKSPLFIRYAEMIRNNSISYEEKKTIFFQEAEEIANYITHNAAFNPDTLQIKHLLLLFMEFKDFQSSLLLNLILKSGPYRKSLFSQTGDSKLDSKETLWELILNNPKLSLEIRQIIITTVLICLSEKSPENLELKKPLSKITLDFETLSSLINMPENVLSKEEKQEMLKNYFEKNPSDKKQVDEKFMEIYQRTLTDDEHGSLYDDFNTKTYIMHEYMEKGKLPELDKTFEHHLKLSKNDELILKEFNFIS